MTNSEKVKIIALMALIDKAMEQASSLIATSDKANYKHWKNSLYSISEDIEDTLERMASNVE